MRHRIALAVAVALSAAACDRMPTTPASEPSTHVRTASITGGASRDAAYGGPSNQCYGSIVLGIARTWPWTNDGWITSPWSYDGGPDYAPPPGSVERWIQLYGSDYGITSVRQLQVTFCGA